GCSRRKGVRDENRCLLADHLQPRPAWDDEAAVEVADDSVRERQRSREDDVDPAWADHLLTSGALWLAGDQAEAADAVAADVHQRAAVEGRVEACIAGAPLSGEVEREGGADDSHPPGNALVDQLGQPARLRVVTPHEP